MLYKITSVICVVLGIFTASSCTKVPRLGDTISGLGDSISDLGNTMVSPIPYVNYLTGQGYTTVKIKSDKSTNDGAPFYLLVKATDFPTFLSEDYEKVVHLLNAPPADQPCFETFCIVPGWDQKVTVETPPDVRAIGVYFFFTTPGKIWKQIIELEEGGSKIKVVLQGNEIVSIES